MKKQQQIATIIFDGECNLCNGVVHWLLAHANGPQFEFVPFQSKKGQLLLQQYGFGTSELETVILIDKEGVHTHSDGFLRIVSGIPGWQFSASAFRLVPEWFRDGVYRMASRNRIRWFGKSGSCTVNLAAVPAS